MSKLLIGSYHPKCADHHADQEPGMTAYDRQSGIEIIFGLLAGALILFSFPTVSVWALGFLLGIDLISHGLAWLLYAVQSVRRTA
jgi:sterol desaturase/sphingolipid hydroxylase (fatty acid hydroxylase superfamily)